MLRCWEPRDAPLLKIAVDRSVAELRRFMPWAHNEPQTVEEKVALLRLFRGKFDLGQDFAYAMFAADESEVVGGTGLHPRGEDVFEIGYWVRSDLSGSGFATEASAALTRVAFEICDASRVIIRVDPLNVRSLAIPRRLQYVEEGTLRGVLHGPDGTPGQRDGVMFAMLRSDFAETACSTASVQCFDATGAPVR